MLLYLVLEPGTNVIWDICLLKHVSRISIRVGYAAPPYKRIGGLAWYYAAACIKVLIHSRRMAEARSRVRASLLRASLSILFGRWCQGRALRVLRNLDTLLLLFFFIQTIIQIT